ncbi:MAG: fused MFS/spermidine synthase, partial [Candidatus Latescibacteria bacterium]|nr:fused MFS/spermidine synthase [Candidatus Latescibacterota bacterium]
STPRGISWLGFFYGGNIAGAVCGCLLAGFYLLRLYDVVTATYVAVALNFAVALIGYGLAKWAEYDAPMAKMTARSLWIKEAWRVYVTIAISGVCALGAQVIWTRLLSLMMGATVYAFSIILGVFLIGLGVGSSVGAYFARTKVDPKIALGWCQLLLVGAIAWSAYALAHLLPYWTSGGTTAVRFQLDLLRCFVAIFPATVLWGISFPLALAAARLQGRDPGALAGSVYAANTAGAIVGALGFSVVLIALLGTQITQQVLLILSACGAILMFGRRLWQVRDAGRTVRSDRWVGVAVGVALLVWSMPGPPLALIAYGRSLLDWGEGATYIYAGEGMNTSVAVSELDNGVRNFHVSGKIVASSEPQDMRLQRLLGHLSALMHREPRSVLVVGCGAGVTAGIYVLYPSVERIVICEIEPLIPPAAEVYFGPENYDVLKDPRVEIIIDDARHYLLATDEKFDIITSDPIHPWVKGAGALYSKEYFELCKKRLNLGGVVTQWVPLYESRLDAVKSEIATFFQVFPHGTIWGNQNDGEGYDVVLLGQKDPRVVNVDALQERLDREDYTEVWDSLSDVSLGSAVALLSTYAGRALDLGEWLADAEINLDRNMRLQYLAGLGLNHYEADVIYTALLEYAYYPANFFVATEATETALKAQLARQYEGR